MGKPGPPRAMRVFPSSKPGQHVDKWETYETEILNTGDPKAHARNIQRMLAELIEHVRNDADLVDEPKAQALFETTAEVLIGLRTAHEHYTTGEEEAMR